MLAPARQLVDGARDDLLAGSAFAQQQHGRLGRGAARDLVVDPLHRGRAPDQAPEAPQPAQLVAQRADLGAQLSALRKDRKSTRLNSSHQIISYAVFCLKKKKSSKRISRHPQFVSRLSEI